VIRFFASCSLLAAVPVLLACNTTSTTAIYTPITGIEIQPSSLLQGVQCGQGEDDVYRYVVIVSNEVDGGPLGAPVASNVFDCFTTGLFENLPASDAGSQRYFLRIFAYSQQSLPPEFACSGGFGADGGACPATEADASLAEAAAGAEWATTCTATQQQGIPVLAVCQPLVSLQGDAAAMSDATPDVAEQ